MIRGKRGEHFLNSAVSKRNGDLLAIGIIAVYCIAYASVRLLASPSMDLDEAEQFLNGSIFSLGYAEQPPLYSWLVWAISSLFGMSLVTLTVVKYCLLFLFYLFFYFTARCLWNRKEALLVMGSLMLFATYAYEVIHDLTHTILVSLMAMISCFLYVRMMLKNKTVHYLLLGLFIGLGMLSKYNFILFPASLILSSLSFREGRHVIFDRRIVLSLFSCILVILPHFLWILHSNFVSFRYILNTSHAGRLGDFSLPGILSFVVRAYIEMIVFFLVSSLFFFRDLSIKTAETGPVATLFRWLALYGLIFPLLAILILRTGHFTSRWLAPELFTLPLAFFSLVNMKSDRKLFRVFGCLCAAIAVVLLAVRALVGFFPDVVGKVERIHIPYGALSRQLTEKLHERGMNDLHGIAIIASTNLPVGANMMAQMPGTIFIPFNTALGDVSVQRSILDRGGILICDSPHQDLPRHFSEAFPSAVSEIVEAPYIHSSTFPPYVMQVMIIPKRQSNTP